MNTSQWLDSLVDSRTDMFSVAWQVPGGWETFGKEAAQYNL
jgi:hypothetical protein